MKIKPKTSELSRDDRLIRGIRNAINNYYEDDEERLKMKNILEQQEWLRILKNYKKLNEDRSEER